MTTMEATNSRTRSPGIGCILRMLALAIIRIVSIILILALGLPIVLLPLSTPVPVWIWIPLAVAGVDRLSELMERNARNDTVHSAGTNSVTHMIQA